MQCGDSVGRRARTLRLAMSGRASAASNKPDDRGCDERDGAPRPVTLGLHRDVSEGDLGTGKWEPSHRRLPDDHPRRGSSVGPPVTYEITHPWIYRIGLQPGRHLDFRGREATPDPRRSRASTTP